MSKKHEKQRQPARRGAGLSSLRPRLDQLLRGDRASADNRQIRQDLDALTEGIKPAVVLSTLLAASIDAPEAAQARLTGLLPGWLGQHGRLDALRELAAGDALDEPKRQQALAWLADAGADTADLLAEREAWDAFYGAYYAGNPSQGSLMIFWYTSRRQHRVHGLGLLLDYEPPWEGAVKDAMRYPQRAPDDAIDEFVRFWDRRGESPQRVTALEAKRRALEALEHNRQSNIRLHPDLVVARELFVRNVLSLPDGPDTPQLSAADFDYLAANGQHPETLRRNERLFGYETRMPDGQKIRILRITDD